jgi:hypothetical protein
MAIVDEYTGSPDAFDGDVISKGRVSFFSVPTFSKSV